MRHSLLVYLLFLSLLLSQTQGIRLDKWFKSVIHHDQVLHDQEKSTPIKTSNIVDAAVEKALVCKEEQCSSGNNRKLITENTSTTSTATTTSITSKNDKNGDYKANSLSKAKSSNGGFGGQQENLNANSTPNSDHEHKKEVHNEEHYADLMEIAEMDYSPARRKPPIHN